VLSPFERGNPPVVMTLDFKTCSMISSSSGNVPLASTFAHKKKAISDALLIFESEGLISKMGIEEEDKGEEGRGDHLFG